MVTTTDGKKYISILDVQCNCNTTGGCERCRKIVDDYNNNINEVELRKPYN